MAGPNDDDTPHPTADEGGDGACWLEQVCPECGAIGAHRADCTAGDRPAE